MTDADLIELYRAKAVAGDAQAAMAFAALWQASVVEHYAKQIVREMRP